MRENYDVASLSTVCQLWQFSKEPRIPSVPSKASGDRLRVKGVQILGDQSRKVPEGLQHSREGLSGKPPNHTMSWWNTFAVEPAEKTPDDTRLSSKEESTDPPLVPERSKTPNTSKPAGRHNVFTHFSEDPNHFPEDPNGEDRVSSQRPPELQAGTARKREETVFIIKQISVPTLLVIRSIAGGVCAPWLSLLKICKLNRELLCVIVGLCWRSVFPMIFFTASLAVLCLASASDVVVVSGATDRSPQETERERPRLHSERHEGSREVGMCCLRCFRRHLC